MTAGLETFAKVRALHDRTTNPGEKAAAASRMEALARRLGMTVAEAVSKLDRQAEKPKGPSFDDIFNNPAHQRARAERERERAEKWRAVVAEYGSTEAVFRQGPWERALRSAGDRFRCRGKTTGWRIGSLWGWDILSVGDPPSAIAEAIAAAYPMPTTVREAFAEMRFWDKLMRDREACGVGRGDPSPEVYFRTVLMERALDTLPASTLNDLRARLDWFDHLNGLEIAPDPAHERVRLSTLRADVERMGARLREQDAAAADGSDLSHAGAVQNGQSGAADHGLAPGCAGYPQNEETSLAEEAQGELPAADPLTSPDPGRSNPGVQNGHEQGGSRPVSPSPTAPEFYEEVVKPAPEAGLHDQDGQPTDPIKSGQSDSASKRGSVEPPPAGGTNHTSFGDVVDHTSFGRAVRRTNADKRRDVLALLNDRAGETGAVPLTDREIARRAGVSPTTVGTIRRAQAARPVSP